MRKYYQQQFEDPGQLEYWSSIYSQHNFYGNLYWKRLCIVIDWLVGWELPDRSLIIEVGCGGGRFSLEAAQKGYRVVGLDFSYGMLVNASSLLHSHESHPAVFLQGDVEALPLGDSSVDAAVCLGVVAYLNSEDKALQELARVVKPGGMLAISIVNKARLAYRLDIPLLLLSLLKKIFRRIGESSRQDSNNSETGNLTTYYIYQFRKSLERAGFNVIKYQTIPWRLLTLFGKEMYPPKIAEQITWFFEKLPNIPLIGSFGGMCIYMAKKRTDF